MDTHANEKFVPYPHAPSYMVGNQGTIISPGGKKLSLEKDAAGYLKTRIVAPGDKISRYAHRIVAQSHIPNPNNLPEVNHINHIKTDNRVDNLEWVTRADNIAKARAFHGNWSLNAQHAIRKPVEAECIKTGEKTIYPSARSWALESGKANRVANICTAIKTGRTAYGFRWRFVASNQTAKQDQTGLILPKPIPAPPSAQETSLKPKESHLLPTLGNQVQSLRRF